jgi:hypothetical protein
VAEDASDAHGIRDKQLPKSSNIVLREPLNDVISEPTEELTTCDRVCWRDQRLIETK